jgi:hypothetical protein
MLKIDASQVIKHREATTVHKKDLAVKKDFPTNTPIKIGAHVYFLVYTNREKNILSLPTTTNEFKKLLTARSATAKLIIRMFVEFACISVLYNIVTIINRFPAIRKYTFIREKRHMHIKLIKN